MTGRANSTCSSAKPRGMHHRPGVRRHFLWGAPPQWAAVACTHGDGAHCMSFGPVGYYPRMASHIPFTGNPLDRAHNFRHDATWMAQQLAHPAARFLLFSHLDAATHQGDPALLWISATQRAALGAL